MRACITVLVVSGVLSACGASSSANDASADVPDAFTDGGDSATHEAGGDGSSIADGADGADGADSSVDAGNSCAHGVAAGNGAFGDDDVVLSDPANTSVVPAVAARAGGALIAWHEFGPNSNVARVAYAVVRDGCVGPLQRIVDASFADGKHPAVAATASGYVLAYEGNDGSTTVVRSVRLDPDGNTLGDPATESATGAAAYRPAVSTSGAGDDVAFAWTTGDAHWYRIRSTAETTDALPVGTTLGSTGLLNYPVLALAPDGTLYLSYRDAPAGDSQYDVYVVTRPRGGAFGARENVSDSMGLTSDGMTLALESDGTLDVVYVDQNLFDVTTFDVMYTRRALTGAYDSPQTYASQGTSAWFPSVLPGLEAVWFNSANGSPGPLWLASPGTAPARVLTARMGNAPALARGTDGATHLVFADGNSPRAVHYAWYR